MARAAGSPVQSGRVAGQRQPAIIAGLSPDAGNRGTGWSGWLLSSSQILHDGSRTRGRSLWRVNAGGFSGISVGHQLEGGWRRLDCEPSSFGSGKLTVSGVKRGVKAGIAIRFIFAILSSCTSTCFHGPERCSGQTNTGGGRHPWVGLPVSRK